MAIPTTTGPMAAVQSIINRAPKWPFPRFNAVVDAAQRIGDPMFNSFFGWIGGGLTTYPTGMPTYVRAYQNNADVYAIINRVATKASAIPFSIKEIKSRQKAFEYDIQLKNNLTSGPFGRIEQKNIGTEAFETGSVPIPLMRPNPYQTWSEFFALSEIFLLLTGNLYWNVQRPTMGPNAGKPAQIYILPSHYIQIVVNGVFSPDNPGASIVSEYLFTMGGKYNSFSAEDTHHMNFPGVEYDLQGGHLYGQSPLRAVLREIQASDEGSLNNIKMMKSGGAIGIIHGENEPLDELQAKQLKQRLVEIKNDTGVMGQIAGISQKIGFTRIALPTKDLMPMDYDFHFQKKIANAIGFPTRLLNNDAAATYDNMALAYRELIINRIMPDFNMMAETLNKKILPQFGTQYARAVWQWDYEKLAEMQDDIETLVKWGSDLVDKAVITRAEMRQLINLQPMADPDMDIPTTNLNVIPLSEAVKYNDGGNLK